MQKAGVHDCFKPHSTRAASSSMAHQRGLSLETIAKSAGWTGARTFAKYYNKPLSRVRVRVRVRVGLGFFGSFSAESGSFYAGFWLVVPFPLKVVLFPLGNGPFSALV